MEDSAFDRLVRTFATAGTRRHHAKHENRRAKTQRKD
jgi:hypothetical protein